jgi:biopolymer transport protein ExbD
MFSVVTESNQPIARIETAPMVGLFAALLALFLLTLSPPTVNAGISTYGGCGVVPFNAPTPREMEIAIDARGALSVQGQAIDAVVLEEEMRLAANGARPTVVTVRAAKTTKFQIFTDVLAAAQRHHLQVSPGGAE